MMNFETYMRSKYSITLESLSILQDMLEPGYSTVAELDQTFRVSRGEFEIEFRKFLSSRSLFLVQVSTNYGTLWAFDLRRGGRTSPNPTVRIDLNTHISAFREIANAGTQRFLRAASIAATSNPAFTLDREARKSWLDLSGFPEDLEEFIVFALDTWSRLKHELLEEVREERVAEFEAKRTDALEHLENWLLNTHGLVFSQLKQLIVRSKRVSPDSDEFWRQVVSLGETLVKDEALANLSLRGLLTSLDCEIRPLDGPPLKCYVGAKSYIRFKSQPHLVTWEAFRVLGFWGKPGDSNRYVENCLKYGKRHPKFGLDIATGGLRFTKTLCDWDLFELAHFVNHQRAQEEGISANIESAESEAGEPEIDERLDAYTIQQRAKYLTDSETSRDGEVKEVLRSRNFQLEALHSFLSESAASLNRDDFEPHNLLCGAEDDVIRAMWTKFKQIEGESEWAFLDFLLESTPRDVLRLDIEFQRLALFEEHKSAPSKSRTQEVVELMQRFVDCEIPSGFIAFRAQLTQYGPRLRLAGIFQEDQRLALEILSFTYLSDPLELLRICNSFFQEDGEPCGEILASRGETFSGLSEAAYRSNRKQLQTLIQSLGFDFNVEDAVYGLFLAKRKSDSLAILPEVGDELLSSAYFDPEEAVRLISLAKDALDSLGAENIDVS